jgi:CubicO group peptidase (beta-lactamase class C family)
LHRRRRFRQGGLDDIGPASWALAPPSASPVTSATGSGSTPAPVGDATPEQYSATPIPQAPTTVAIGELDGIADDVMNRTGIPGMAIAVVHGEKVFYAKGFGVRELGTRERSTSKPSSSRPRCRSPSAPLPWRRPSRSASSAART